MAFEQDAVTFLGGVRHGSSLGSPLAIMIGNSEWPKWQTVMSADPVSEDAYAASDDINAPQEIGRNRPLTRPRPGHADLVGMIKRPDRRGEGIVMGSGERVLRRQAIVHRKNTKPRIARQPAAMPVMAFEIADEIGHGTLSAGPTRLDVFARHALPYVGSCGALDMINFGAWDTVPEQFRARRLYRHNPTVTLMRTTVDENRAIGEFIAAKLNAMRGPVRFLIPEGGVSAIDRPGQPFHDPEADRVLFATIEQQFRTGGDRKLLRLPLHINDEPFADALVAAWHEIARATTRARIA